MFQFLEPEATTPARLRVISRQDTDIQDEYMNRIRIDDMRRDQIDQLSCNVILLSEGIEEESKFRNKIYDFIALKNHQKAKQL